MEFLKKSDIKKLYTEDEQNSIIKALDLLVEQDIFSKSETARGDFYIPNPYIFEESIDDYTLEAIFYNTRWKVNK